ncbi:MAG: tetratricopeptide repeat protein [Myxococcales bacterium]|nr:tetratricopeptide repeat protein [Myxococcales bacterium]
MTAVLLLALGLGGLAAGILVGRYYVPDDRALRRTARHAESYVKAINLLLARDRDAAVEELVAVVAENVDDVEPYFALGALFRNRGEWERAIRVHQAIELREHGNRALCQRARYQLGLDFRAAGMPRRATRAMEDCLESNPKSADALRALCSLYEEQGRFAEAAETLARLSRLDGEGDSEREHHLLCAAAQRAIENDDVASAKRFLKAAEALVKESAHLLVASAELAAAKNNWKGASDRLRHALRVEPEMVSYLAGPLRAAEIEMRSGSDSAEVEATQGTVDALRLVHEDIGGEPLLALASAEMLAEVDREEALGQLHKLSEAHPNLLPARVAAARVALASGDSEQVGRELAALVGERGVLESSLDGRWCCPACGQAAEFFSWRCGSCRRWGSPTLDLGAATRVPLRERRERRLQRRSGNMGAGQALPEAGLDSGLSAAALQVAGSRSSALGRAGSWVRGALGAVRGTGRSESDDTE